MNLAVSIYVIGDVHGQYEKLVGLLRDAKLIGTDLRWSGGPATLWFMGDFFDRGPDGIGVVDLVMRLQTEAAAVGGQVRSLLGNHEPLILAAYRFDTHVTTGVGGAFLRDWERNGGVAADLTRLTPEHMTWITNLPAMAHVGDRLFAHADATFYRRYGRSVAEVNRAFSILLRSDDLDAWDGLLGDFAERLAFDDAHAYGTASAREFLDRFGGRQLIHGHTPICYVNHRPPGEVTHALVYAGGLCVNVDGGMNLGGPGFIYQLSDL